MPIVRHKDSPYFFSSELRDKCKTLYAIWQQTDSTKKIATSLNLEDVLATIADGDTLIYVGGVPYKSEIFKKYLKDTSKKITLDLSYCNGDFIDFYDTKFFQDCTSLKKVIIGHIYSGIKDYTFCNCSNLAEVEFLSDLKNIWGSSEHCSIGEYAFYNCALTSITIPESAWYIDKYAFAENSNLTSVTFEKTSGWKIQGDIIGTIDVSDPATNATKLTSSNSGWLQNGIKK